MGIDDIPITEPKQSIDVEKYEGAKVKIAEITDVEWIDSHYVDKEENGKIMRVFDKDKTVKAPVIYIITEPLDMIPQPDGSEKPLVVKQRFNLQISKETGKPTISKHAKAKLWMFMRKMRVTKLSDLKSKFVSITLEPSKDENDDRRWLRIAI